MALAHRAASVAVFPDDIADYLALDIKPLQKHTKSINLLECDDYWFVDSHLVLWQLVVLKL